jgi:hypothetical protein
MGRRAVDDFVFGKGELHMLRKCTSAAAICVFSLTMVASGQPNVTPFLSVDLNGNHGPTQEGWAAWNFDLAPTTNTFSNTFGAVNATLTAINNAGANPGSRNRVQAIDSFFYGDMYTDLVFIAHDSAVGLGRDYIALQLSGLTPNRPYEVTVYNFDAFHDPQHTKWMAWSIENPAAWLDANVGEGESYQPTNSGPNPGVYKNPIPTLGRIRMGGPWPSDPVVNDRYAYSGSYYVTADSTGSLAVYGWADLDAWDGSQHGLLNGFGIGNARDGDANLDGMVNIADLGILAANWQQSDRPWSQGDFNGDGLVNIADLGILAANWQAGTNAAAVTFAEALAMFDAFNNVVVPEPGVLGLGALGLLVLSRRCR